METQVKEKIYKTPEYTRRAQRAYRERQKLKPEWVEMMKVKSREYKKLHSK